ncbi:hypothetical protein [Kibdelosporangium phytohabitans]|uniref:Uncharacterized protein n=1 Tax=Kibdelosporangium phytohabitans TaxID=860235 RepID=A0A0N9I722_9PSEU|nr:hypothetical protein [Kibdelosporangium phytohabitans]ALG10427.1 hypothetical protein AOZ06_29195 [Kibdelosporangium phytohabitans]MBE1461495.1 hypothetical protein [Kibdelosporangium phytohabitans]
MLVIRQQTGDGSDGVVECVAAAEMSDQGAPVLHVGDGVLDTHSPLCMRFPLRFTEFRDARHLFEPLLLMFRYGLVTCPRVWAPNR